MKKIWFALLFTMMSGYVFAQKINRITLKDKGSSTTIMIAMDEGVVMNLSQEGALQEWGVDRYAGRENNIPRQLDEYTGRVEYYTEMDNEAFRGKIKYIGRTLITYYAAFENPLFVGKIKAIGSLAFEYYSNFDDLAMQGKIKTAGSTAFTYFSSFDNEAFKGKIKTVGSVAITYYSSVDDKAFAGKVKSLNGQPFVYYTSQDQKPLRGFLRTGRSVQLINGVTFWVLN